MIDYYKLTLSSAELAGSVMLSAIMRVAFACFCLINIFKVDTALKETGSDEPYIRPFLNTGKPLPIPDIFCI